MMGLGQGDVSPCLEEIIFDYAVMSIGNLLNYSL